MLNQKVADLINDQINKELYSAYLYLDFSNYYYDEGLSGYGNWYFIQAQEERDHAMLMLEYLRNNGMSVTLKAIDKPDKEIKSFEEEEDTAETNLKKFQLFGSDPKGLYALDAELGARVYTAPSLTL